MRGFSAVPPMFRIERPTLPSQPTRYGFAVVLSLAAAAFLYLAFMVGTKATQVREVVRSSVSAADDMIDEHGRGPASWSCADVPIAVQCGSAQPEPGG